MASTQPIQPKNLDDWHSPQSRTDVIDELIHGVGESGVLSNLPLWRHFDIPIFRHFGTWAQLVQHELTDRPIQPNKLVMDGGVL